MTPTPRPSLPSPQFCGLCVVVFFAFQLPLIRLPVLFLSTWAHELGHGLGAIATGGRFLELTVFSNFSGVALTETYTVASRAWVVVAGLLGPSVAGTVLLVLTRGFGLYRAALAVLAAVLLLSLVWAADGFTLFWIAVAALGLGLAAWKLPARAVMFTAYVVAIALCLSALTGFGYFFIGNAEVAGAEYRSDTGVLSDLWGGPHWLWGGLLAGLSVILLAAGAFVSTKLARRRGL